MSTVEVFEGDRATNYNSFVKTWIPNYQYFLSLIPYILDEIHEKKLLVVGCGTGNEISVFKDKLSQWQITGIDPSSEMLSQAKEKFESLENIDLILGEISDIDPNQKFNAATLLLVLHFIPDNGEKLSILKQIFDKLNNNSPLILLDITGSVKKLKENLSILMKTLPETVKWEEKESRSQRIINELYPVSEKRIIELLKETGFSNSTRFFQSTIYHGWIAYKN